MGTTVDELCMRDCRGEACLAGYELISKGQAPVGDGGEGAVLCFTEGGVDSLDDRVILAEAVKVVVEHCLHHNHHTQSPQQSLLQKVQQAWHRPDKSEKGTAQYGTKAKYWDSEILAQTPTFLRIPSQSHLLLCQFPSGVGSIHDGFFFSVTSIHALLSLSYK